MSGNDAEGAVPGPIAGETDDNQTRTRLAGRRVAGKAAIVTGAGRGIGRSAALRLAEEGAKVLIVDRKASLLESVRDEVAALGAEVACSDADLLDFTAAEALMELCVSTFGRLDILINNVGGATRLAPYEAWKPEEIEVEIMRSLLPTAWCCRAALPYMLAQGAGRIVNVGAESVRNGLWDRAPYNMAKGAVHALTTSIARETADKGITCNCVAPGTTGSQQDRITRRTETPMELEQQRYVAELSNRTIDTIPMGRSATSEEQAAAIVFLASEDASFITGQVLSVNGGSSML